MKKLLLISILFINIIAFPQEENKQLNHKIGIELNGGVLFSNYRYYKYYNGLENFNLGVSKDISKQFGLKINQSYSRMFNERINNRAFVLTTTLNTYATFLKKRKFNIRLLAGIGLLQIHTKCLYNSYPVIEHIYGITIKTNLAVIYKLNNKLSLNINTDALYGFIQTTDNYIPDSYYYKTFFYSFNMGVVYYF